MLSPSARKVVHRSPSHSVWRLSLPYLQDEAVEAESSLERDFVHLAALYPATASIKHQPFHLTLKTGGYTPDFLVTFTDGSRCVIEVKPHELLGGHEDKLEEAAEVLQAHEHHFVLALDTHLRKGNRHENALVIRRYGKARSDSVAQSQLVTRLTGGPVAVGQLKTEGYAVADMAHAVCHHKISLGPFLRLDDNQVACLVEEALPTEGGSHAIQFEHWLASPAG